MPPTLDHPRAAASPDGTPPPARRRSVASWILAVLIGGGALYFHARSFLPFFDDDALISLRYADRLLSGHGLTWTDGPRVEGYSNLLWILLVCVPGLFGADLVVSARGLGFLCMLGTLAAVSGLWLRAPTSIPAPRPPFAIWPALVGALILAAAAPVAVWSIGGLEQPLVALLLAWGLVFAARAAAPAAAARPAWAASICFALLCLTRPDSPIFVAATVVALLAAARPDPARVRRAAIIAALPVLAVLGQAAFRLAYYGSLLPNPAWVKITPSSHHFLRGLNYLAGGFTALLPLSLAAAVILAAGVLRRDRHPRSLPLALNAVAWALYITLIGGDIFAAWRHWTPLLVIMALAIADATRRGLAASRSFAPAASIVAILLTLITTAFFWQRRDDQVRRALTQRTEWDGRAVGLMLRRGFAGRAPRIAVDAAGAVPYWSKLPALDMLGLCDPYIPFHPPGAIGRGFLGHELGDGRYVLDQKPDLVLFKDPRGRRDAVYLSGRQMQALPDFARQYALATFAVPADPPFESRIWIRRDSPAVGIRRETTPDGAETIAIPAWLFNQNPRTVVHLTPENDFCVPATRAEPVSVLIVSLSARRWTLIANADGPIYAKILTATDETLATGSAPLGFDLSEQQSLTVMMVPTAPGVEPIHVRGITLAGAHQR
ncbi:MAG: hypothetical protein DCC65_18080 [Planctomycetota bacterium]|nr:MAG: hypothetical protein DCC65_18080 [Planctomycetota bacterium]